MGGIDENNSDCCQVSCSKICTTAHSGRNSPPQARSASASTSEPTNSLSQELYARHEGLHILNFNTISRRWFTGNRMQSRPAGKRLLADLVLRHHWQDSLSMLQPKAPSTSLSGQQPSALDHQSADR
ncbi:hypothetical protein J6590_096246, partial [Homalodisca vitripennis]